MSSLLANLSFDALKEPRGFIRVLELFLAIFAFATSGGYNANINLYTYCNTSSSVTKTYPLSFGYPFRLEKDLRIERPICPHIPQDCNPKATLSPADLKADYFVLAQVNLSSSAEFYVFVGVVVFLFTIASIVIYCLFDDRYRTDYRYPILDFVISGILVVFWLASSAAFAKCVTDVKFSTSKGSLLLKGGDCDTRCADVNYRIWCQVSTPDYAGLNISIIFGFLNMAVWAGNLWFLWKETPWHSENKRDGHDQMNGGMDPPPPQVGLPSNPVGDYGNF